MVSGTKTLINDERKNYEFDDEVVCYNRLMGMSGERSRVLVDKGKRPSQRSMKSIAGATSKCSNISKPSRSKSAGGNKSIQNADTDNASTFRSAECSVDSSLGRRKLMSASTENLSGNSKTYNSKGKTECDRQKSLGGAKASSTSSKDNSIKGETHCEMQKYVGGTEMSTTPSGSNAGKSADTSLGRTEQMSASTENLSGNSDSNCNNSARKSSDADPGKTGRVDIGLLKGNDVNVTFSGSLHQPGNHRCKIKAITYQNKALDVALLEIENYQHHTFPKTMCLCKCLLNQTVTEVSLIGFGHPKDTSKKQLDPRCRIKYIDDVRPAIDFLRPKIKTYKDMVRRYQKGNPPHMVSSVDQLYNDFDSQDKLLWSCYMENGGSGSPVINHIDSKSLKVVALYTHAIPGFLQYLDPLDKRDFPCDKRFEMGPRMSSIFLDLQQTNRQLANELFPGNC